MIGYSDVDWAGDPDSWRSTTGYTIFLEGNLNLWSSKKQPTVFKSSIEVEYHDVDAYMVLDTLSICSLLAKLGVYHLRPCEVT